MEYTDEELKLYGEYLDIIKKICKDDVKEKYAMNISTHSISIEKINGGKNKRDVKYQFYNESGMTMGETIKETLKEAPTYESFIQMKKRDHRRQQLKKLGI